FSLFGRKTRKMLPPKIRKLIKRYGIGAAILLLFGIILFRTLFQNCGKVQISCDENFVSKFDEFDDACHACSHHLLMNPKMNKSNFDDCQLCDGSSKTFFFIETKNNSLLLSRQACSVESASFHHPQSEI